MKSLLLFLFSIAVFAQDKPLELKIDRIEVGNEKNDERRYTVHYHIANLTDKPLSFVLNTRHIIPIASGSLRASPYYKIYENGKPFEAEGVFSTKGTRRTFASEKEFQVFKDSLDTAMNKKSTEELLLEKKEHLLNNIKKLGPHETKTFEAVLIWNKKRYYKSDMMEYYIGEENTYDFELHIHLMSEILLRDLEENQITDILKGQQLTKGWYTSNKVPIDFSQ